MSAAEVMWEWFSLFAVCMLTKPYHLKSELTNNTAKTQMGCISLPLILNAIIGISY